MNIGLKRDGGSGYVANINLEFKRREIWPFSENDSGVQERRGIWPYSDDDLKFKTEIHRIWLCVEDICMTHEGWKGIPC